MVKVGKFELAGELVMRKTDQFVEDVPVSDKHVRFLMESLSRKGQVEPLLTWADHDRIINGFHRLRGMKLLGWKEARCLDYSCSEEDFRALRISSAVAHEDVTFARVVLWVREAFAGTKWAAKMEASDAFRGKRNTPSLKTLNSHERSELLEWVLESSRQWDLSTAQIAHMLRIAELAHPALVGAVRDEPKPGSLTRSVLEQIATKLPRKDLQQMVAVKVQEERLTGSATQELVRKVAAAETTEERDKLLHTVYRSSHKSPRTKGASIQLQQVRVGLITDSLKQIGLVLPEFDPPQSFDELLGQTLGVMAIYRGGEHREALEILQRENQSQKNHVQQLEDKLERKERDLSSMRRTMGSMQQEIDNLRRRD